MKKKTFWASLYILVCFSVCAQNKNNIEVLANGDVKFYKVHSNNAFYIENVKLKTGEVQLDYLGDPFSQNANRAKLRVIFADCVESRTKVSKSDLSASKVIQLINEYHNCKNYTTDFELSVQQQLEQKYAFQKSIINFDIGFGYYNETVEFAPSSVRESTPNSTFSIYGSFNISPAHLGSLTGRLFYDFSFQYNANSTIEFGTIKKELSSFFMTLTPKYYIFNQNSKFNPFIGASFGAAVLNYDLTQSSNVLFNNIDSSSTTFIYGLEAGAAFLDHFELTLSYLPNYQYTITIDDETVVNSRFSNVTIKLGYKF
jgi:hypothetical protein